LDLAADQRRLGPGHPQPERLLGIAGMVPRLALLAEGLDLAQELAHLLRRAGEEGELGRLDAVVVALRVLLERGPREEERFLEKLPPFRRVRFLEGEIAIAPGEQPLRLLVVRD